MPRRIKPSSGQINLLSEVFDAKLRYQPKISWSKDGLAVVVLRLPPGVDEFDRAMSMQASKDLARTVHTSERRRFRR